MSLEEIKERVRKGGFHVPTKVQKEYLQDNGYGRICWRDYSIVSYLYSYVKKPRKD